MGLELERSLKLRYFASKLMLFPCFLHCSFISDTQISIVALKFAHPLTQKLLNLAEELGKY
jgi:hypothetical protein